MTEKKDKKPGKKERLDELEGKLREAKANRSAVKPHFDAKRKEIETSRKEGIKETLSAQGRAKKEADKVKTAAIQSARDKYESAKKVAQDEYASAEEEIRMERDEAIESAAQECQRLSHDAAKAAQEAMQGPSEKHTQEMADIEESWVEMMGDADNLGSIAEDEKKAADAYDAEVASLLEQISKLQSKGKEKAA